MRASQHAILTAAGSFGTIGVAMYIPKRWLVGLFLGFVVFPPLWITVIGPGLILLLKHGS